MGCANCFYFVDFIGVLQRGHVRPVVASDIETEIVRVIREWGF